jgi:hypothetical protein
VSKAHCGGKGFRNHLRHSLRDSQRGSGSKDEDSLELPNQPELLVMADG